MTISFHQQIHLVSGKVFQLTPKFLNTVLGPWMLPEQPTITEVRVELLTGDAKFNALLLRIYLTYDQSHSTAPCSLIAKLPTANIALHDRTTVFQPGTRENWFYRSCTHLAPVHVPHCYFNDIDRSTGESVLLLEDLAPAQSGSWFIGASLDQAKIALESLARFHAYWWGKSKRKEIQELTQLLSGNWDEGQNLVQELYDSAWPKFQRQQKLDIPDDVRRFGAAILGNMKHIDDLSEQGPFTLVHGDYRLDNLLFGLQDGELNCWVLDWEDVYFGSGMIDLTWFLGSCLPLEQSQHEMDLLHYYHQILKDEGLINYTWDECYADYRRNMCSSFVQGVLSATLDQGASEYDYKLAHVIGERFIGAAQRHQLLDLIQ